MYFLSVVEEVHRYFTWGKVEIPQWKIYSITIQVLHSKFDMSKSTEIMYLCDEAKLPDVLNQFFACFNTQRGRSAPLINLPAGDLTLVSQHHQMRTRKWMQAGRQAWMECLAGHWKHVPTSLQRCLLKYSTYHYNKLLFPKKSSVKCLNDYHPVVWTAIGKCNNQMLQETCVFAHQNHHLPNLDHSSCEIGTGTRSPPIYWSANWTTCVLVGHCAHRSWTSSQQVRIGNHTTGVCAEGCSSHSSPTTATPSTPPTL